MRALLPEASFAGGKHDDPVSARRRQVLRETIAAFEERGPALRSHADDNLAVWGAAAQKARGPKVQVHSGDWGDVTASLTKRYGVRFAALNMANATRPGGSYVQGTAAQEENMFRRTDCHFSIRDGDRYGDDLTALISARDGRVLLDVENPRTVIRGAEDRAAPDLGYPWLRAGEIFSFYELRSAAVNLKGGKPFDEAEARRRIAAQLDTLIDGKLRHAVLGAFGCGAFRNPAHEIARLYREELQPRLGHFEVVAFAIFDAGYGPENYTPFKRALAP